MSDPKPAATVLLVRDGAEGPEVFMVQRNRRVGFLPNAWVFPGGRVDAGDRLSGQGSLLGELRIPGESDPEVACAIAIAAVRETFEESGLWLGPDAPVAGVRERLLAGGAFAELLGDAWIDLSRLRPWSWWVTPAVEPRRYDTRFLVARAPEGEARHDDGETVASAWVSPRSVVASSDLSSFPLAPPTWWTLRELAEHRDVDAILGAKRQAHLPIEPILEFGDDGLRLKLPGHPEHGAPAVPGLPDAITWDGRRWIAWRNGEPMA